MPPELEPVLRDPQVIEAMVAVVLGVLALIGALLGLGVKRIRALQKATDAITESTAITKEQVTNNHKVNFRDEVTEVKNAVTDLREIMEVGFRRMDHQIGEIHDQVKREAVDRQALDARAQDEHARIWTSLNNRPTQPQRMQQPAAPPPRREYTAPSLPVKRGLVELARIVSHGWPRSRER